MAISWAEATAQWQAVILMLDEHDKYTSSNSNNVFDMHQAAIDILRGAAADKITQQLETFRRPLADRLTPAQVRAILTPVYVDLMEAAALPDRGFSRNAVQLRDHMVTNSFTVKARDLTFATPSAGGGNVGNGNIFRLTVDEDDHELQGGYAEAVTLICVQDQLNVDEFEEVFEYQGARPNKDFLKLGGSGLRRLITSLSARNSESLLRNPSFDSLSGTQPTAGTPIEPDAVDSFTGWTLDNKTLFEATLDDVARGSPGVATPLSLSFNGDGTASQILQDNVKPRLPRADEIRVPYLLAPAYIRKNSCAGTNTMHLGSQSTSVAMSGLTNDVVTRKTLDLDSSLYYPNWNKQDADVKFVHASHGGGTERCIVDDIILTPMVLINGLWYAVIGADTSFLFDDVFTWTDSEGTRAKMQYWSSFRTGLSTLLGWAYTLPSDGAGYETVTDPT